MYFFMNKTGLCLKSGGYDDCAGNMKKKRVGILTTCVIFLNFLTGVGYKTEVERSRRLEVENESG